ILDDPAFDQIEALESHKRLLRERADRLARLLITIDKTIAKLTEDTMSMTDEELYEGFTPEQIERYTREVNERYDPKIVAESNRRVRQMSKAQWQAVKAEGGVVAQQLADLMNRKPGDVAVQSIIARHYAWVDNFWHPTAESYRGLGQGYAEHPEFRAFYEKYRPGLADFMCAAMSYYADHTLTE
ncbi:MAG TPA: TipAS antibiotic-recognition domain-containing protein, partial [Anaerolineae bacterium]|nr:TipAS antibiotic-recognition domain-containing protein [Anaerolineae bacterium]